MIELKTELEIIAFDGRIIARYQSRGDSDLYHIDHVAALQVTTTRRGRHFLELKLRTAGVLLTKQFGQFASEDMPQAQALIAAVNNAIAARS